MLESKSNKGKAFYNKWKTLQDYKNIMQEGIYMSQELLQWKPTMNMISESKSAKQYGRIRGSNKCQW